jgi:very-short-patch-repair endonuclease
LIELPTDRVVRLTGTDHDDIASLVAYMSDRGPAIVTYHPPMPSSPAAVVAGTLNELEAVAIELFPSWLPGALGIDRPGGAGIAAVRAIAIRAAASSRHFGPFLADLAERALCGIGPAASRFSPEVRAAGLARVLAAGFHRSRTALVVAVPPELPPRAEEVLVAGCEWLADHGDLGIWLVGAPLDHADWVETVSLDLPKTVAVTGSPASSPLAGQPHPRSSAESALESALARHEWSAGRAWNQVYQSNLLANPVVLDLLFAAERCVVEVDGPEHCDLARFESDHRRDVMLHLDGYAVLRFTNARIRHDVETVVSQIEQFIRARRLGMLEGH